MTKEKFLAAYREFVTANYAWTIDTAKLDRFMESVKATLTTDRIPWAWNSSSTKTVWKALGGKGPMTLKGLRALPAEKDQDNA